MKNREGILNRFLELFRSSGKTKHEFSDELQIEHQSLNKYLKNEYDLQKISLKIFDRGYSIDWLYSGEGSPSFNGKLDEKLLNALLEYDIIKQKERIYNWICENYENLIEFEIERKFDRYEVQNVFSNNDLIPYTMIRRICNAGCNISWTITGEGSCYADNDCGNELREKNES